MSFSTIKTLVLFAQYTDKISYYDDWKSAFLACPEFATSPINICDKTNIRHLDKTIKDYDFIVLLHSTNADTLSYLAPYKGVLNKRKGKLLVFVGNEVNLPRISMKAKINFVQDIEAEFIGTQLLLEAGRWLYDECKKSRVVALPHALNPDVFKPIIPQEKRQIDIGVRAGNYWPCLGDNERTELFNFFTHHRFYPPIALDISTTLRLKRNDWAHFLNTCKATISNEAGSYYLERDDATVQAIEHYIKTSKNQSGTYVVRPDSNIEKLWLLIPYRARQVLRGYIRNILKLFHVKYYSDVYEDLDFQEIFDKFFLDRLRPPVYTKAISSRHFDAIGTKVCQIMFKGRFNDILKADEHYIALERDFSNIDSVMEHFQDFSYRQTMVNHTYGYIMAEHTYKNRIDDIRDLISSSPHLG